MGNEILVKNTLAIEVNVFLKEKKRKIERKKERKNVRKTERETTMRPHAFLLVKNDAILHQSFGMMQ